MTYEINVALNGRHYFATHERSIDSQGKLTEIVNKLRVAFPESEGYSITATKWSKVGKEIKL